MKKQKWIKRQLDEISEKEWDEFLFTHIRKIGLENILKNKNVVRALFLEFYTTIRAQQHKRLEKEWEGSVHHYRKTTKSLLDALSAGNREDFETWVHVARDLVGRRDTPLRREQLLGVPTTPPSSVVIDSCSYNAFSGHLTITTKD